jgi:hypothetical protein
VAKVRSNWVHPDVSGDCVGRIVIAQNVVMVFFLPESFAGLSLESSRRVPFQDAHELKHIALRLEAFRKQVNMIGHEAIRVHGKQVSRSGRAEDVQEAIADLR